MLHALRLAFRSLGKSPGFTAVAILTLALGIGFSTSSFSIADTLLLQDVPYPQAGQLVRIFGTSRTSQTSSIRPGNALPLRDSATSFRDLAFYAFEGFALGEPGQPAELTTGLTVSPNFFQLLGVQPFLGRGFVAGEDEPGKPRVTVITQRTWTRRYASDPSVIGRTVRLNTENYTIVGVLPATFDAPLLWGAVDYVAPLPNEPDFRANFSKSWLRIVARLQPRLSLQKAQGELSLLAAQFTKEHPQENTGFGLRVTELHDSNMDRVSRNIIWLMTAISLLTLLIACANLASLQVARAFGRSREFAIRAALGGGRFQLMVPLLVESLVLAIAGGLCGLLVASWANRLFGSHLIINGESGFPIAISGRVFAYAVVSSLVSALAFGLAPAWLASRSPAAEALKEGARGASTSHSHNRLKNIFIVCELALALALVGAAGTFGIGAKSFLHRPVGWNPDGLFAGYTALPANHYTSSQNRNFQRAFLDRLAAIPGVESAAIGNRLPTGNFGGNTAVTVEGRPAEERSSEPITQVVSVSPDYFKTLDIPLKAGAFFSPTLTGKDPAVAIINESFAKRLWPDLSTPNGSGENAVGRRIRLGTDETWIEIVGVVGDVQMLARFERPETTLQLYRPTVQYPQRGLAIALRSSLAPESLTKSVREAAAQLDANLPIVGTGSLRASAEQGLQNLNLAIINLGVSAGMGLLIAGVGLFGVISQLTIQRTRDIGVRMALGAQSRDIMWLVVGGGIKLLLVGMIVGIPGYFGLNHLFQRAMPEMQPPGLWLLAVNIVVLSAAMLLACWLPARRATKVDPVVALRSE